MHNALSLLQLLGPHLKECPLKKFRMMTQLRVSTFRGSGGKERSDTLP